MATKSILKTVEIHDKSMGRLFAHALADAENTPSKDVTLSRKCTELKGDSVKDFFERNN